MKTLTLVVLFAAAVTMNRYDRSATGANINETVLSPRSVNAAGFGKLYSYYVDGAVYGQPLYVPGLAGHNVLYVATMNDKVYAFDADKSGPPLWMRNFTDEMAGITPVPVADVTNRNDLNVVGNAGIESTPVIDPAARAIYVVARTKENGAYFQRLHKLDLKSGKELHPSVIIGASAQGVAFDPRAGNQRAALALVQGNIVIAWASHEDIKPYHGWVMAYDAATLQQTAVFCTTPTGSLGGIWQSGRGPAVDSTGAIYFEVGNGSWDGTSNFGTSVLKLRIQNRQFKVEDSFTPPDYESLNQRDTDLGSSGPLLIPGTNLLLCGDKKGELFLLDTGKLSHLIQSVQLKGGRILAGPAYWDSPTGPSIYQWGESDFLKAFHFQSDTLDPTPFAVGSIASHGSPGGALTLSADGKKPGTGIVWATLTQQTVATRQAEVDQVSELTRSKLKSEVDLSFAKVNLSDAKLMQLRAQDRLSSAYAALGQALGSQQSVRYRLSDEPMPPEPSGDAEALIAQAFQNRPELASLRLQKEADQKFVYAERDLNRPTVSLAAVGGALPYIHSGNLNANIPAEYEAAAVNVHIPVFNGHRFSARRQAAEYQLTATEQRVRGLQDRIARDVRTSWERARTSFEAIGATQQLLAQANLALDLAQGRYNLGLSSIVELTQAQLGQTSAEVENLNAKYEYQEAYAALQYTLGQLH